MLPHKWKPRSDPLTVLKTAGLASASVHKQPLKFGQPLVHSAAVRCRPLASAGLVNGFVPARFPNLRSAELCADAGAIMAG